MNGFKTLFLLLTTAPIAFAQVETGKERDYGWSVNPEDGVLEYIVQIKPEEVRAMQERSVAFPNGQEDVSNIPRELVGRIARVVVRIGNEVLPRTPSLEELERMPPINSPLNPSSTALLGPGRMQDVEGNVYNIQRDAAPSIPDLPSSLGGTDTSRSRDGNLIDEASKAANAARNSVSDALSSVMPSANDLAQNFNSQNSGGFLDAARGNRFELQVQQHRAASQRSSWSTPEQRCCECDQSAFPERCNQSAFESVELIEQQHDQEPSQPSRCEHCKQPIRRGIVPSLSRFKAQSTFVSQPKRIAAAADARSRFWYLTRFDQSSIDELEQHC